MPFPLRSVTMLCALGLSTLLGGCSYHGCCGAYADPVAVSYPVAVGHTVARPCSGTACGVAQPVVATPTKFIAVGYGNVGSFTQYSSHGQQALMAMRAARLDAYRNLAEQVHGVRVWGNTAVSAFVTQNDSIRTYVDAFIRGARVVNMANIGDGNYEVTVELELPPTFTACLLDARQCGPYAPVSACVSGNCVRPSAYYVTQ
ncbi:MAG TPA: LPP20 family lipoprotein [Rhodocyclaceae bacterium]|nr:LPP20 family lipoprotein [Rhodocyclaceae bacterium]